MVFLASQRKQGENVKRSYRLPALGDFFWGKIKR
jgi:hypothetical protein